MTDVRSLLPDCISISVCTSVLLVRPATYDWAGKWTSAHTDCRVSWLPRDVFDSFPQTDGGEGRVAGARSRRAVKGRVMQAL